MSSPSDDRIAQLEARLAEQDRRMAELERCAASRRPRLRLPRLSLARRLTVAFLALMLAIPAGVVLANHQFSDVPTSNPFHADIEALANSGVTLGCGSGNYCPKANVTREQMAAFLNRLGALAPDKTPVVNADRVDGKHANQLSRVTRWDVNLSSVFLIPQPGTLQCGFRINAPAAGFITVNASITLETTGGAALAEARISHGTVFSPWTTAQWSVEAVTKHIPLTWVFPVSAGENSFCVQINRGTNQVYLLDLVATAIYTPYGWNGGSALEP